MDFFLTRCRFGFPVVDSIYTVQKKCNWQILRHYTAWQTDSDGKLEVLYGKGVEVNSETGFEIPDSELYMGVAIGHTNNRLILRC